MYENENLTIDELKNSSVDKLQDNQYVFTINGSEIFYSYKTIIAIREYDGTLTLDSDKWDYSKTTSKYRNIFLNMTTKETQEEIKNGNIKTANLN
tara:strand:- start:96 stop:380 length:285 start_codon:yes stop_codon:yes gene_type:complete